MIKVVSFTICPFVQRVTATLEAKHIPYQIEYISLSNKPDWFLAISPNGQVPVLITEAGMALFESDAIVEYIEDAYGPLQQGLSHEKKAFERSWSYQASKHYLTQCGAMSAKEMETFEPRFATLRKAFERAEKQLSAKHQYFSSDDVGKVDIAWLPLLYRADLVLSRTGCDFLTGLPKVKAWSEALLETELGEKSVADDFIDKFSAYYLTGTFIANNNSIKDATCCQASCCE
ncbi:glutathione S-transferase family protein [Vibrio sp. S4M6]|uniref:glutathione S-transferase family protein n=1 Tax=Vibrio sinus TaxID=2946865 RepID=UPI00202A504A|nr:glutathione S-transferase family protein [Vibrio sinus]MCL9783398.1 glutathione S-transferase family protein [Vibrio sinus]